MTVLNGAKFQHSLSERESAEYSRDMAQNFTWTLGGGLPGVEAHSDRKLSVIEQYLSVYFDTVARDPRIEVLNITLIDAFCGGGMYQDAHTGQQRPGSPLVLLHSVERARQRLNQGRKKPLEICANFRFSDQNADHVEFLREVISQSEFADHLGSGIDLRVGKFADLLPGYIRDIKSRQSAGRSIFVLDQFGYTDVPMTSLRMLFAQLHKAEVLLTFSIDALLNYLTEDSGSRAGLAQFGVDTGFLLSWADWKSDKMLGRATAQRVIMEELRAGSGAEFFTPFMLHSSTDNRWMVLAHLSQNQAARDKMLSVHWEQQNSFRHIGRGSLYQLGFDQRCIEQDTMLFNFATSDREQMSKELANELPGRVFDLLKVAGGELPVHEFLSAVGNQTAATNEDLLAVLGLLSVDGHLGARKRSGGMKRPSTLISTSDTLVLPEQPKFYFFDH